MAIDHGGSRHVPVIHVVQLNLRQKSSWDFLMKVSDSDAFFSMLDLLVELLAELARSDCRVQENFPLRSEQYPLGLPGLNECTYLADMFFLH